MGKRIQGKMRRMCVYTVETHMKHNSATRTQRHSTLYIEPTSAHSHLLYSQRTDLYTPPVPGPFPSPHLTSLHSPISNYPFTPKERPRIHLPVHLTNRSERTGKGGLADGSRPEAWALILVIHA